MSDLAIVMQTDDENPIAGDLRLVDGQLVLASGRAAIAQDLQVRLRWFRGEWFSDRRMGVPWFQRLLGLPVEDLVIERVLRRAILDTAGVASIETFSLARSERSVSIDFAVRTTAGGDALSFSDFVIFPDEVSP